MEAPKGRLPPADLKNETHQRQDFCRNDTQVLAHRQRSVKLNKKPSPKQNTNIDLPSILQPAEQKQQSFRQSAESKPKTTKTLQPEQV